MSNTLMSNTEPFMDVWPAVELEVYLEACKKVGVYDEALMCRKDQTHHCIRATFLSKAAQERANKLSNEVLEQL